MPPGSFPSLSRLSSRYPAPALAWLKRNGDSFIVTVQDPAGRVGIDYGVYGVPETQVIDKRCFIRYKHIGPLKPETAEKKVRPLLRQLNGEN